MCKFSRPRYGAACHSHSAIIYTIQTFSMGTYAYTGKNFFLLFISKAFLILLGWKSFSRVISYIVTNWHVRRILHIFKDRSSDIILCLTQINENIGTIIKDKVAKGRERRLFQSMFFPYSWRLPGLFPWGPSILSSLPWVLKNAIK